MRAWAALGFGYVVMGPDRAPAAESIEFLKGLRSLIDDRIAHLSTHEEPKGKQVTVE